MTGQSGLRPAVHAAYQSTQVMILRKEWVSLLKLSEEEGLAKVCAAVAKADALLAPGWIDYRAYESPQWSNCSFWELSRIPALIRDLHCLDLCRLNQSSFRSVTNCVMAALIYQFRVSHSPDWIEVTQMIFQEDIVDPGLGLALERLRHGLRLCYVSK